MLNTVYRLVAPRKFEIMFQDIDLAGGDVLVRPTHLSICHADQRYYQGKRDAKVLAQKLPMALIHEGIGKVVFDPMGTFHEGERVIMIPNTPVEQDEIVKENYLRSSKFRASGFDGFMQEYVALKQDRLISLPDEISDEIGAFTEIISVSVHAISRFEKFAHKRRNRIGIWGDGNLGYITAMLLKFMIPESTVYVLGVNDDKLEDFTFADEVINVKDIPQDFQIDHAFECVGGEGSQKAINQMIDYISPEGTIALLGVSEYPVPINTRMVLEKGLRLFGSSRSGREDFLQTVEVYRKNPEVITYLGNLVTNIVPVQAIEDMKKAFELDIQKSFGKTILIWK
ncbi:ribitol-5-phosphate dehydrogenase [Roseburia sp. 499]|uniref:ribitol-5-phosphate dehydrogenase n=1 Tax=Roseburia sp. 499 TaxID=1261634 RepID=UPI000952E540|nr:ribitol-5-phosphate dehydrogenase [Roseburia sp. 499]WVK69312.1 ribitol-5-phosphate dehydrogenase [Roseburia sp. 499]